MYCTGSNYSDINIVSRGNFSLQDVPATLSSIYVILSSLKELMIYPDTFEMRCLDVTLLMS